GRETECCEDGSRVGRENHEDHWVSREEKYMRKHSHSSKRVWMLGVAALTTFGGVSAAGAAFTPLTNAPPAFLNSCLLLTDGSVMCQGFFSNTWHRLTPDAFGSYVNGTWDAPPI